MTVDYAAGAIPEGEKLTAAVVAATLGAECVELVFCVSRYPWGASDAGLFRYEQARAVSFAMAAAHFGNRALDHRDSVDRLRRRAL